MPSTHTNGRFLVRLKRLPPRGAQVSGGQEADELGAVEQTEPQREDQSCLNSDPSSPPLHGADTFSGLCPARALRWRLLCLRALRGLGVAASLSPSAFASHPPSRRHFLRHRLDPGTERLRHSPRKDALETCRHSDALGPGALDSAGCSAFVGCVSAAPVSCRFRELFRVQSQEKKFLKG